MNITCQCCKEVFNYAEEVHFYDGDGMEIDYSEASTTTGYTHVFCFECVDENDVRNINK